ncbi:MAG: TRAP transporter fused permease subunit, partial [Desulfobacteraceae bacterium]|nr:TRAP transporter fused permease subunit [Desulfobacteraceae bacterium]
MKIKQIAIRYGCVLFLVFNIWAVITMKLPPMKMRPLFLLLILGMSFLMYAPSKEKGRSAIWTILDFAAVILTFIAVAYLYVSHDEIVFRAGELYIMDIFFGIVLLVVTLEATRRSLGWPIPIIALIFIAYALLGNHLPGNLRTPNYDLERIIGHLVISTDGIFGIALKVMLFYVMLYIAFGAFLSRAGGLEFFMDLSNSLTGRMTGGPAKIAVVSSGFLGSVSGSSTANAVTTGAITIPMMKRIGFSSSFAAGVESAASCGGQFMPPVMGASAFIIAEFLGMSYLDVCKAALIPAVLFFLSVGMMVHFEAKRLGIKGLPKEEIAGFKRTIKSKGYFLIPIIIVVYFLLAGYSASRVAIYGIMAIGAVTLIAKPIREFPGILLRTCETAVKNGVGICAAAATLGIIIGITTLTGFGLKLSSFIVDLSHGYLIICLVLTMLTAILLGMGVSTTICYIFLATMVAPALVQMGVIPISAHLFIFYFGMMSMVTPPVALTAYAAAGIACSDPMKT